MSQRRQRSGIKKAASDFLSLRSENRKKHVFNTAFHFNFYRNGCTPKTQEPFDPYRLVSAHSNSHLIDPVQHALIYL
jgi:hypothetical protein